MAKLANPADKSAVALLIAAITPCVGAPLYEELQSRAFLLQVRGRVRGRGRGRGRVRVRVRARVRARARVRVRARVRAWVRVSHRIAHRRVR